MERNPTDPLAEAREVDALALKLAAVADAEPDFHHALYGLGMLASCVLSRCNEEAAGLIGWAVGMEAKAQLVALGAKLKPGERPPPAPPDRVPSDEEIYDLATRLAMAVPVELDRPPLLMASLVRNLARRIVAESYTLDDCELLANMAGRFIKSNITTARKVWVT